ncbi:hypothetical protein N0V90_012565 [Kalmusia sp. IMI 367209]|nr:hypothetical protein N0V90_012565 [Kalmusia sp. IMI 367209]
MRFPLAFTTLLHLAGATGGSNDLCRTDVPSQDATDVPRKFGLLLFRGVDILDVLGPDEVLMQLGRMYRIERALIAETLDPVTSEPLLPFMNALNSSTWTQIVPTHTYDTASELDVLLVPGGAGARNPALNTTIEFLRDRFPKVKYFMTVCTGAMLAAKAGILDGKNATTNKQAWKSVTAAGPNTNWIGDARWVVDGKIWTASGVAAGIDAMVAFVKCTWGEAVIKNVTTAMEYVANPNPQDDPFAVYPNGTYINPDVLS